MSMMKEGSYYKRHAEEEILTVEWEGDQKD